MNTCAHVKSPHYLSWFCFPHVIKTLLHSFYPYITFYLCSNATCSYVPVLIAMQQSVALRTAFYRGRKKRYIHVNVWVIFSFNWWLFLFRKVWTVSVFHSSRQSDKPRAWPLTTATWCPPLVLSPSIRGSVTSTWSARSSVLSAGTGDPPSPPRGSGSQN